MKNSSKAKNSASSTETRPKRADLAEPLLDQQICFALYSTSRAVTSLYRPVLSKLGITYPQYLVLLILWDKDEINVSDIGERLMLDTGTLTPLLKRLEANGLIVRERRVDDERQVSVRLTKMGRDKKKFAGQVAEYISCSLSLTEKEYLQLHQQLSTLKRRLLS